MKPRILIPVLILVLFGAVLVYYRVGAGADSDVGQSLDHEAETRGDSNGGAARVEGLGPDSATAKGESGAAKGGGTAKAKGTGKVRDLPLRRAAGPGPKSVKMPDGSYFPVLNGAFGAPAMRWPDGFAYSPVARRFVDRDGMEWYEHKDGTYSTTQMVFRKDLGHEEPMTRVLRPEKALPKGSKMLGTPGDGARGVGK